MPERKHKTKFRVECDDVQGEGSYCVMSGLTVEAASSLFKDEGLQATKNISFEEALELASVLILEWNWVDDDGEPLPQVKDDPSIVRKLHSEELNFLMGHLNISSNSDEDPDQKN